MKKLGDLFGSVVPITYELDHSDFRVAAIAAHKDKKYGELPYAYHLARVESTLILYGYSEYKYVATAWLQNILEDTGVTYERILSAYNEEIAEMVFACTREGLSASEKEESVLEKITQNPLTAPVKCADILCNVEYSLLTKDYKTLDECLGQWDSFRSTIMPLMIGNGSSRDAYFWNNLEDKVERAKAKYAKRSSKSG